MIRRRALWCGLLVLAIAQAVCAQEVKTPLAKMELADGDTLVFLGDSITHQCLYTQYVEDYFFTRFPKLHVRFHNSGVGGDRAEDALVRFDRDVAAYKPKYVTILLGMNDGGYMAYNPQAMEAYRRDMPRLIEQIQSLGATPILMTPTMYDSRAARARPNVPPERLEFYNGMLAFFGAWLREQATDRGLGFVDMYSPLNNLTLEARKQDPTFTMIPDAVHPGPAGQLVMAYAVLNDLGLPRPVSNIVVQKGADDKASVRASGGKVSDARYTSDGVEFSFEADSLPLVLPEEARIGVELTKLGHRLSREAIEVHGLAPGKYQLLIDGQAVGTYPHINIERHVELQGNDKAPQYQQSLAVTALNKQRNDEAVRPLRNLWRDKKVHRRLAEQLKATPDNAKLAQQVAGLEKSLATFEEQIASLEQKALTIEEKIRQGNIPPKRQYRLVRVDDAR
jgi:lysophospholipase L1-like esterase